jgi:hypothetical protein
MSANGRIFRSKAGVLVPTDDAPATPTATTPAAADTRRHVRESDRERDTEQRREVWSASFGEKPERLVGQFDYRQRRPELESWAQGWGAPENVKVVAINAQNQPHVGAATDGRTEIHMNMAAAWSWSCPVKRLAALRHEVEHIVRGDLGPVDDEGEDACDAVAVETIVGIVAVVEEKTPSPYGERIDARTCQRCFAARRTSCRQSESSLARIIESFAKLMGIAE